MLIIQQFGHCNHPTCYLQKQYIFIYRALMEVAQYGDTEIPANELKGTIEKLRQCEKDSVKSKMEEDFEVSSIKVTYFPGI